MIQKLEGLLDDDLAAARQEAQFLLEIKPPGGESVSAEFAKAAIQSANQYNDFLQGAVEYLISYVDILNKVKTAYAKQDHVAIEALRGKGKAD